MDKIFKYYVNLSKQNGDKSVILNLILTTLHRIHGRIVVNACVKYQKQILIGVGDMHPDGQISDGRTHARTDGRMDGRTDGWTDGRTDPKSLSPTKILFLYTSHLVYNV